MGDGIAFQLNSGGSNTLHNSIIYDLLNTQSLAGASIGINAQNGSTNKVNCCTVYLVVNDNGTGNCWGISVANSSNNEEQNNIAVDTGGTTSGTIRDYETTTTTLKTSDFNLSSDTSAPGGNSLQNKTSANQFVSTVDGSEDLHLKAGADAIGAGADLATTPTGVEVDIDGRDRDAQDDTWDIGADQFVVLVPPSCIELTSSFDGDIPLTSKWEVCN